jgi:hypothetical protein
MQTAPAHWCCLRSAITICSCTEIRKDRVEWRLLFNFNFHFSLLLLQYCLSILCCLTQALLFLRSGHELIFVYGHIVTRQQRPLPNIFYLSFEGKSYSTEVYTEGRTKKEILKLRNNWQILILNEEKKTPWPQCASELYRQSDRCLSAKLVPTFADRVCRVASVADY